MYNTDHSLKTVQWIMGRCFVYSFGDQYTFPLRYYAASAEILKHGAFHNEMFRVFHYIFIPAA